MSPSEIYGSDEQVELVDLDDNVIGTADRAQAIGRRWLYRVALTVCLDGLGRVLVMRRPDQGRMPGAYTVFCGGAVKPGEGHEMAAARELREELGVSGPIRHLFTALCPTAPSPVMASVHEAIINHAVKPDPDEIGWHAWVEPDHAGLFDYPRHVSGLLHQYEAATRRGVE